jgi:hypothetical protein
MARIRTIKPEFFTSEDIVELCPFTRLLYIALWCEADRDGRLVWKPRTFKMRYFPADNCDIDEMCHALLTRRLLVKYGGDFAFIPSFSDHQHVNPREKISNLPIPTDENIEMPRVSDASRRDSDGESTLREERKGKEGNEKGGKGSNLQPAAAVVPKEKKVASPEIKEKRRSTWASYVDAFFLKYGTEPIQDAKSNSCVCRIVESLGDEAPDVAAFYLTHNGAWYVQKSHSIEYLAKDCSALRTQWATSNVVTARKAHEGERIGARLAESLDGMDLNQAWGKQA